MNFGFRILDFGFTRIVFLFNSKSEIRLPKYLLFCLLLALIISPFSYSQTQSNLDVFYSLADSTAKNAAKEVPASVKEIGLELNSGTLYSLFNTTIISAFQDEGIQTNPNSNYKVIFVVDNASVTYGEMFRDGFLGSYLIQRKVLLEGNYFVAGYDVKQFSVSYEDTVNVDDVEKIENYSFPFTRGEVPAEPFFSGLFEPVVAIGTAAAAVILFFIIRSK